MSFERAGNATSRADQTTVRRANLGVVLQQIAGDEPRSRARVAAETGLTRGTVSSLVAELIELELLRETGEDERSGRVGRPAQTLELGDRVVAVGLEVNVDYLAVCVEDLDGRRPLRAPRAHRQPALAAAPVLDRLARMAREALDDDRGGRPRRRSASRSRFPGLVEAQTGTLLRAPNLGWSEIAGRGRVSLAAPGLPVRVDNEANLAALAEHWQGVARDLGASSASSARSASAAASSSTASSSAALTASAASSGTSPSIPTGRSASAARRGCLETFVGQEAIARRAGICRRRRRPRAQRHARARPARRAGRPGRARGLAEAGRYLGIGLASAVNLFDVDVVVLGGCFGPLAPWLADDVQRVLRERVLSSAWSACEVRASEFGEGAAVRGAAALTLLSVLAEPWLVAERAASPREGFPDHASSAADQGSAAGPASVRGAAGRRPERTTKEVSTALDHVRAAHSLRRRH